MGRLKQVVGGWAELRGKTTCCKRHVSIPRRAPVSQSQAEPDTGTSSFSLKARTHSRARQQGTIARSKSMKLSTMARYLSQIQEQEKVSLHNTGTG